MSAFESLANAISGPDSAKIFEERIKRLVLEGTPYSPMLGMSSNSPSFLFESADILGRSRVERVEVIRRLCEGLHVVTPELGEDVVALS